MNIESRVDELEEKTAKLEMKLGDLESQVEDAVAALEVLNGRVRNAELIAQQADADTQEVRRKMR